MFMSNFYVTVFYCFMCYVLCLMLYVLCFMIYVCLIHSASRCSTTLKGKNSMMTSHGAPNSGPILLFSHLLKVVFSCLLLNKVVVIF